jgi:tetratricopeptide (TPR) repeat protein
MVAVVAGERVIARVKSGQRWTGPLLASSGARATSEAAGAVPAASDDAAARPRETAGPDCLALARGGLARRAVDCFARIAEGTGLSAEMALYEMARLRRDVLGDAAGAAAALEQYRRQFPRGSLRTEVDVSLLELLPRLGRAGEALADSERLLATAAGRERALELRLLRGNIYRELLRDFGRAEVEYAPAAADRGATGDEASFQRAVCLQALGRVAEARAAFRRYAERPNPRHAAEAARLRGVLDGRE